MTGGENPDKSSMRGIATMGLLYTAAQSLVARVFLLFSQIILGWLLTPADFGTSALAGAVGAFAWSFQNFGTDDVLLQRGNTIHRWEKTTFFVSLATASFAAILLVFLSPFFAELFDSDQIPFLLLLSAIALVMASLTTVPEAKIRFALKFKWLAGINLLTALLLQILIVSFAYLGFGAASFFLPLPFVQAIRVALLWQRARPDFSRRTSIWKMFIITRRAAPVFVSKISETVLLKADYIVLGLFASTQAVGFYTFAFRLAAVPIRVLAVNLRSVLVPMLTKMKSDPIRQQQASLQAAEILVYAITPLCYSIATVAEPAMQLFFGEKWRASTIVLQLLCIGMPAEGALGVARARLSAQGKFRQLMNFTLLSVIAFIAYVMLGAALAEEKGVALFVSLYALTISPLIFFRVFRVPGEYLNQALRIFAYPVLFGVFSLGAGVAVNELLASEVSLISQIIASGTTFFIVYVALIALFQRSVFNTILEIIGQLVRRNKKQPL